MSANTHRVENVVILTRIAARSSFLLSATLRKEASPNATPLQHELLLLRGQVEIASDGNINYATYRGSELRIRCSQKTQKPAASFKFFAARVDKKLSDSTANRDTVLKPTEYSIIQTTD